MSDAAERILRDALSWVPTTGTEFDKAEAALDELVARVRELEARVEELEADLRSSEAALGG